jgi:hypothetical protein
VPELDQIAFEIKDEVELGIGTGPCVEIMINGRGLLERMPVQDYRRSPGEPDTLESRTGYAGLDPFEVFRWAAEEADLPARWPRTHWKRFLEDSAANAELSTAANPHVRREQNGYARRVRVLRCSCGDEWCSSVLVEIRFGQDRVRWQNFSEKFGSRGPEDPGLGPFEFERLQYQEALGVK